MRLPSSSIMAWLWSQIVLSFHVNSTACYCCSLNHLKQSLLSSSLKWGHNTYWQDCCAFSFLCLVHALPPLHSHHHVLPGLLEQPLLDLPAFRCSPLIYPPSLQRSAHDLYETWPRVCGTSFKSIARARSLDITPLLCLSRLPAGQLPHPAGLACSAFLISVYRLHSS